MVGKGYYIYIYVIKLLHNVLVFVILQLDYFINNIPILSSDSEQFDEDIYNRIDQYLISEKHFLDKNLTIEMLARRLSINKKQLNKILRVKYNMAFHAYINRLRIDHSCALLLDPRNKLIEVIAEECSFNSIRTFESNFKKRYNMSPSEYRRIHRLARCGIC